MISEFKIISITKRGEDVLQNNLNEWNSLPPHAKLMWKALFSRTVTHNPLVWRVVVKNSALSGMLDPSDLIKKLCESMEDEGCKKDVDYKIVVMNK